MIDTHCARRPVLRSDRHTGNIRPMACDRITGPILSLWLPLWLLPWVAGAAPLFDEHSMLDVELVGPIGTILEDRDDREELSFVLHGQEHEFSIKVRARGNSRLRICSFPPLRLNFRTGETTGTIFAGQDKLKLVTPCKRGGNAQLDVLEEYAAYRIFGLLSDASFRVRLVRLTFTDTDDELNDAERHSIGFLIESKQALAARLDGELAKLPGVALSWLDAQQAARVYVFQYLIGNTDWSLVTANGAEACCHNGQLLRTDSGLFYVPYDFDLAGLVNAPYAKPDPSLPIKSVRSRRYRGFCLDRDVLQGALAEVVGREQEILGVLAGLPDPYAEESGPPAQYVQAFFAQAADQDDLLRRFEKRCLD